MDFQLTREQEAFRQSIRDFFRDECPPGYFDELDREAEWPFELYQKIAQHGWVALPFPEQYGGSNGGIIAMALLVEEIAYASAPMAMGWSHSAVFGGGAILTYGNDEQKERFLPRLCRGEIILCFALTEPNSGSDAASLQLAAVDDGDCFVLNGTKILISGASASDYAVTFARTDKTVAKHKGITGFIFDLKSPGVTIRTLRKMGNWPVHSCEIVFNNVRIPKENVLGGVNQGWNNMLKSLDLERIVAAGALCIGIAQRAVDDAIKYARQVSCGGRPLIEQQAVAHRLVDMQAEVDAMRTLAYRAAWMLENKIPCSKEASITKLISSEGCIRLANAAVELLGPYGYFTDWELERGYRDSRMHTIGAGTSQVQRTIIAREIGL
ncbi:MAG: acyl-CoA/acyl-ACP dehydrogenase [Chloroflexi bacterium]|nr:acyl-CoA/acyl-ACP dehydrogenase [Chloroflexota bacterium]